MHRKQSNKNRISGVSVYIICQAVRSGTRPALYRLHTCKRKCEYVYAKAESVFSLPLNNSTPLTYWHTQWSAYILTVWLVTTFWRLKVNNQTCLSFGLTKLQYCSKFNLTQICVYFCMYIINMNMCLTLNSTHVNSNNCPQNEKTREK